MRLDRRSWHPNRSDNHNHFYLLKLQKDRFIDHVTLMITHITAADVHPKRHVFFEVRYQQLLQKWINSPLTRNLVGVQNCS